MNISDICEFMKILSCEQVPYYGGLAQKNIYKLIGDYLVRKYL